jgi:hypothetical protein
MREFKNSVTRNDDERDELAAAEQAGAQKS